MTRKVLGVLPSCLYNPGNQEQLNFILTKYFINQGVVTSLMLDGTYLSRNLATLEPLTTQPPYEVISSGKVWA